METSHEKWEKEKEKGEGWEEDPIISPEKKIMCRHPSRRLPPFKTPTHDWNWRWRRPAAPKPPRVTRKLQPTEP